MEAVEGLLKRIPPSIPWFFTYWTPASGFRFYSRAPDHDHASLVFMVLVNLLTVGCGKSTGKEWEHKLRSALFNPDAHFPRRPVKALSAADATALQELVHNIKLDGGVPWLFVYEDNDTRMATGSVSEVHKEVPTFSIILYAVNHTNRSTAVFNKEGLEQEILLNPRDTPEQESFYASLEELFVPLSN